MMADMGFKGNFDKSALSARQNLCWLGIVWNMVNTSLSLVSDNPLQWLRCVRMAYMRSLAVSGRPC